MARAEMDDDLLAALMGDDDEEGCPEELPDDFVLQAEVPADIALTATATDSVMVFGLDEDGYDYSQHLKPIEGAGKFIARADFGPPAAARSGSAAGAGSASDASKTPAAAAAPLIAPKGVTTASAPARASATTAEPAAAPRRKTAYFAPNVASKRRVAPASRVSEVTLTLDGGWQMHEATGAAFGQGNARSCARAIAAALRRTGRTDAAASGAAVMADGCVAGDRPWAVRGEVPLEDERSACGCTAVIFGGVRHQMPEKVFGSNWLELRHEVTWGA